MTISSWFKARSSLRARIFWTIVPVFLALFLLIGFISVRRQTNLAQAEFIKRGETTAANLAYASELGVLSELPIHLSAPMRAIQAEADVGYVFIYSDAGKLLKERDGNDGRAAKDLALTAPETEQLSSKQRTVVRESAGPDEAFIEFVAPVLSAAKAEGEDLLDGVPAPTATGDQARPRVIGFVRVGLSLEPVNQYAMRLAKLWGALSVVYLLLGAIAIFFVARRIIEPITQLTQRAEQIAQGDLDRTIPVASKDELGQLASSFNKMAQSLKGNITSKEALVHEVSELNRTLEDRIRLRTAELQNRSDELEVANRHKSEFLANMSHELRTPLNAIIGYSEMLEEEAEEAGVAAFVPDLRKIYSSGKHLLSLINNVLDLSKIEAGRMELYLETFDVPSMLADVSSTIQKLAEKNHNTLSIECGPNVDQMHADVTRVRQCLFNLLSNACKFTENGRIDVTAKRRVQGAADWMEFQVKDTGIGMTPEQKKVVFEAFRQADASTTRKYGGTGLGLTISQEFCQVMGGDITVDSEVGKGSSFTIRLPTVVAPLEKGVPPRIGERPPATSAEADIDTRTVILVIDDDETARDLMNRHLAREGFRIIMASNGEEGLDLARRYRPAVITLDVMMPGMDGWAVLRSLKDDPLLRDIPVIMVTIVNEKNMGYALGAAEHVNKPIDRDQLLGVLSRYRCPHPPCPVLLVEDDESVRRPLRQLLEKEGWVVTEAANGRIGLECVAANRPELIILDLMMPEMDGFDFLLELRRQDAWRSLPVVVITSKDLTAEDRQRLSGNVERVLQKGAYNRDELLDQVRELVMRSAARQQPASKPV